MVSNRPASSCRFPKRMIGTNFMAIDSEAPHTHRLTVEQYHKMICAEVFDEDKHVELLEGELIEMSPQHFPHKNCLRELTGIMHGAGAELGTVLVQLGVKVSEHSEPEPDLVLLRPPARQYRSREWSNEDVLLMVEAGEGSRRYDRERKMPVYARAGIPELWLIDLVDELVHIYRRPENGVYRYEAIANRGDTITPEALPNLRLLVDELFPAES